MINLFKVAALSLCMVCSVTFAYAGTDKEIAKNDDAAKSAAINGPNFVDKDGDGICDNYYGKGKGGGRGKRFRTGARDGSGPKNGSNQRGPNFVDKNGDGFCDRVQQVK